MKVAIYAADPNPANWEWEDFEDEDDEGNVVTVRLPIKKPVGKPLAVSGDDGTFPDGVSLPAGDYLQVIMGEA